MEITTKTHYLACLDSVQVINDAISNPSKYEHDETVIERNVRHLETMRIAEMWTDEDMTPLDDAISAGNKALLVE
jgi:hypothetical protein